MLIFFYKTIVLQVRQNMGLSNVEAPTESFVKILNIFDFIV